MIGHGEVLSYDTPNHDALWHPLLLADACVWLAYGGAKVIISCHAICFIGQFQTDGHERQRLKPVANVWNHQRLQTCLINERRACLEQTVVDSYRDVSVPCALDVFDSI